MPVAAALGTWFAGCSAPLPADMPDASDPTTTTTDVERRYACTGAPTACDGSDGTDRSNCKAQAGCYWNNSTDSCDGLAGPCGYFRKETSCADQAGCAWIEVAAHFDNTPSKGCTGSAEACVTATLSQCAGRAGCAWDEGVSGCYGVTVACAHRYSEALCKRGASCEWRPLQ